jgi:chromate transporter
MTLTEPPRRLHVTRRELFVAFMQCGVSGFGGVLPFARRMLVDERKWLTELEFNEVLSLGQFLPGPNIVNVSIMVGRRFQGIGGSLAAVLGLMLLPLAIILSLAALYGQVEQYERVRSATGAMSAAAAGLMLSVGLKMARPIQRTPWQIGVVIVAFVAIGLLRLPLLWVLATLGPAAYALAWWLRK